MNMSTSSNYECRLLLAITIAPSAPKNNGLCAGPRLGHYGSPVYAQAKGCW